jgi:hypothetical protein
MTLAQLPCTRYVFGWICTEDETRNLRNRHVARMGNLELTASTLEGLRTKIINKNEELHGKEAA